MGSLFVFSRNWKKTSFLVAIFLRIRRRRRRGRSAGGRRQFLLRPLPDDALADRHRTLATQASLRRRRRRRRLRLHRRWRRRRHVVWADVIMKTGTSLRVVYVSCLSLLSTKYNKLFFSSVFGDLVSRLQNFHFLGRKTGLSDNADYCGLICGFRHIFSQIKPIFATQKIRTFQQWTTQFVIQWRRYFL